MDAGRPASVISSAFFAALVYCRYLYPTHPHLTTPLSTCEPPPDQLLFPTKLLTPTYQSHVSAVITCVCPNLHLLIPFPNPGLGYRAAEKPDPLLSSPLPPLAISPSLSLITGLCRSCNWKVKNTTKTLLFNFIMKKKVCLNTEQYGTDNVCSCQGTGKDNSYFLESYFRST